MRLKHPVTLSHTEQPQSDRVQVYSTAVTLSPCRRALQHSSLYLSLSFVQETINVGACISAAMDCVLPLLQVNG